MELQTRASANAFNTNIQKFLHEELLRLRMRNPAYSLRAFARKLGMPASALSEILQGKRQVSMKAAVKITDALILDPAQRDRLLATVPRKVSRKKSHSQTFTKPSNQLTMDHFRTISEWYHFAILSLAETRGFQSKIDWIARRLGLTKIVTTAAIQRLLRLQMLIQDDQGLKPTGLSYVTPDEIAELSLRKAHACNLELARNSLEQDAINVRDFTSMTMAIDPAKIPEAKRRIRDFQKELCLFLESENKDEVFKICIQLFPLTKNQEGFHVP